MKREEKIEAAAKVKRLRKKILDPKKLDIEWKVNTALYSNGKTASVGP